MQKKQSRARYNFILIVLTVLTAVVAWRLFAIQIIEGESYKKVSDSRLEMNVPLKASRGEILDRYGRTLVTNRAGNSVAIANTNNDSDAINSTIINLACLFDANGAEYTDTFPVMGSEPFDFTFEDAEAEASFKQQNKLEKDMTGRQLIEKYSKRYKISEDYSLEQVRKIAGIRYEMEQKSFSPKNPYLFAADVDISMVTVIKEQSDKFKNATVYQEPIREYVHGNLAAHILGRIGIINAQEYETLRDDGYGMNDTLGKQGVEKAFESYLKGRDGVNNYKENFSGKTSEQNLVKSAVPGKSVLLTIDLDLQKTAEEALESTIKEIAQTHGTNAGADANAGAVAVIDVASGEILALASYPNYDPKTFNEKYNELINDKSNPIFNRALNGIYEPGSTYKMVTSLAALENEFITPQEKITTKGVYKYLNHSFACHIYRSTGGTHGTINISQAIAQSCNYFFYEVGRRTGIEQIDKYAEEMGLDDYTGIELEGEEAKGQIASPELRKQNGGIWYPGDVLQAAIGQSDNLFTPIQMANYVATLANGGTNYKAHLLKAVKSNETDEMEFQKTPEIKKTNTFKPETLKAIYEGMKGVTTYGTATSVFKGFPVISAGKTGSAQVSSGSANAIFVGFAPVENPQIAVAVVVEHGASGGYIAPIARKIYEEYFFGNRAKDNLEQNVNSFNTLLQK